ncbi:MAG: FecR domain-containing protein [Calditrichaeota bacterium]|nr:FecR domain-containing protein [Calditrichota bacterium]
MWRRIRHLFIIPMFIVLMSFMQVAREPIGKITFPLNRVFVIRAGTSQLLMAHFNMEVYPGDKIETKKESRCEITLKNGDVVRIDENSIYTLEDVKISEKEVKAESFLSVGRLWSNIRKIFSKDDYFKVKSPSAVIAVRGTIYRVNANPDTTTQVFVYDGEVQVSPYSPGMGKAVQPGQQAPQQPRSLKPTYVPPPTYVAPPQEVSLETWIEIVRAQQQIVIKPDGTYEKAEFDPVKDAQLEWVQWNKRRDEMLQR